MSYSHTASPYSDLILHLSGQYHKTNSVYDICKNKRIGLSSNGKYKPIINNSAIYHSLFTKPKLLIDETYKSRLVEKILLGMPIIPLVWTSTLHGLNYIVHGNTEIQILIEFLENKFALTNLKYLNELSDFYYKDLFGDIKPTNGTYSNKVGCFGYYLETYQFDMIEFKPRKSIEARHQFYMYLDYMYDVEYSEEQFVNFIDSVWDDC